MPTRTILTALFLAAGCGVGDAPGPGASAAADTAAPERPVSRTDTLLIEGTAEPIRLRLFRASADFPIPFGAYVPEDMRAEASPEGDGAAVRFVAEFGGVRNDRAFIHLFVHPAGTDPQAALAVVRAYEASTGVPVSAGLEPLGEAEPARGMEWADQAYSFGYQAGGAWYVGSIGLGSREGRLFHLVTHYPAEYGDGFGPRADLLLDTWRWGDGSPLRQRSGPSDVTIPSARRDP